MFPFYTVYKKRSNNFNSVVFTFEKKKDKLILASCRNRNNLPR